MKGSRPVVLALFAALMLLLSGCFRPAGDSIQPTTALDSTTIPPLSSGGTPSAPAITLLSPATNSGETATAAAPALTQVTLAPATPTQAAATADPLTATLQIITPGISLSIMTPDTPIPQATDLPTPEGAGLDMSGSLIGETTAEALESGDECTYTVEPGDSLYLIAISNDTTVAGLQEANPELEGDAPVLQIGQVIRLSDCVPGESGESQASPTEAPTDAEDTETEDSGAALPEGAQTYRVQPGDTLYAIAIRFGVTVNAITRANELTNPNALRIGQELIIPPTATPSN